MPLPIVGFRDMYELKTLRQGRAKPNLMRDSVMSKAPEPEWQPEYQKEPPLEAPMFSPDDLIGAGKSADELYQLVQGSANRAGIPKAEVMPGSAVGNYRDLKWGDVPGTGVLTRDLVQELERNAAATRALDATGAPQQLARGVQAAGRSFADRTASPIDSAAAVGRSDIDKFLSVLQKGGLRGLLDRTRPVEQGGLGYAGLPAAGGLYLAPNNDDRPLWERLYSR